jgi:hypothetical protein
MSKMKTNSKLKKLFASELGSLLSDEQKTYMTEMFNALDEIDAKTPIQLSDLPNAVAQAKKTTINVMRPDFDKETE